MRENVETHITRPEPPKNAEASEDKSDEDTNESAFSIITY